ncbi:acyl carrier protein [Defluviimonas sp. D31]|uniref:acyl carrier protein n=1 Tax=Defluviimonas sp. D31 TaxID=3083253 RepID=UPI00296F1A02|nr:acyl carrier protein [Defluviimonas sp. D31]MDW4548245.1 acyl carrier protein [Defluviimonas sp. D31]
MSDTEARLREITATLLDADPVAIVAETKFVDDLGVDSLETIEILMALEYEFGIEIPDDEIEGLKTFGEAVSYIQSAHRLTVAAA